MIRIDENSTDSIHVHVMLAAVDDDDKFYEY